MDFHYLHQKNKKVDNMITKVVFFLVGLFSCAFAQENLSIVYVHIGDFLPSHIFESIRQVRLYNPMEDLYLCANREALDEAQQKLDLYSVKKVPIEALQRSKEHLQFLKTTSFTNPFWIRTSERLLIVDDLITHENLTNVFHIESDVMVYMAFRNMLPVFIKNYSSMAIPFANDYAAICSIVFCRDKAASHLIAECTARHAPEGINDMRLPGILKEEKGVIAIDHLPILPPIYIENVDAKSFINKWSPSVQDKFAYCKYFDDFGFIFDAVTFGTLLSRQNKKVCEGTVFDPRDFNITWKKDERGLYVPYVSYLGLKCRICNLHIHAKNLHEFRSDRKKCPVSWVNGSFIEIK